MGEWLYYNFLSKSKTDRSGICIKLRLEPMTLTWERDLEGVQRYQTEVPASRLLKVRAVTDRQTDRNTQTHVTESITTPHSCVLKVLYTLFPVFRTITS